MSKIVYVLNELIEQFCQEHARSPALLRLGRKQVIELQSFREAHRPPDTLPERPSYMEIPIEELCEDSHLTIW